MKIDLIMMKKVSDAREIEVERQELKKGFEDAFTQTMSNQAGQESDYNKLVARL